MNRLSLSARPPRAVPAVLVALVLLVVAVLAVWSSGQRLATGTWPSWWSGLAAVQDVTWGTAAVVAIAAGVVAVGIALLLAAVVPGPPSGLSLGGSDAGRDLVVTRSGLARMVTSAAASVSGVDDVRTSVGAGRVRVRVSTPSAHADDVGRRVDEHVQAEIRALRVQPEPRVTVIARTHEARSR